MTKPPTLNISLPKEAFLAVASGEKHTIRTKTNPRKERYFAAKSPAWARIRWKDSNMELMRAVTRIEKIDEVWCVHVAAPMPHSQGALW